MKKIIYALISIIIGLSSCKKSPNNIYIPSKPLDLPEAKAYMQHATIGNKLFFVGGEKGTNSYTNAINVYDVSNGTWSIYSLSNSSASIFATSLNNQAFFSTHDETNGTEITDKNVVDIFTVSNNTITQFRDTLSEARRDGAAAAADNKILFAGGFSDELGGVRSTIDILTLNNGKITKTTKDLTTGRILLSAAGIKNKILFAGGVDQTFNLSKEVEVYDTKTDAFTITTPLSKARVNMAVAATSDMIFFAGGDIGGVNSTTNNVDIYQIQNNVVIGTSDTLSVPRAELTGVAAGSKVLFAGGITSDGKCSDIIDVYDTNTKQWTTMKLKTPRRGVTAAASGNIVLFAGGKTDDGNYSKAIDFFLLK